MSSLAEDTFPYCLYECLFFPVFHWSCSICMIRLSSVPKWRTSPMCMGEVWWICHRLVMEHTRSFIMAVFPMRPPSPLVSPGPYLAAWHRHDHEVTCTPPCSMNNVFFLWLFPRRFKSFLRCVLAVSRSGFAHFSAYYCVSITLDILAVVKKGLKSQSCNFTEHAYHLK